MKITLKKKKISNGRLSIFIEYYKGKVIDLEGKAKHNRDFEYLKEFIYENPKNGQEKQHNKEKLAFAENILSIRKAEYAQGKYGLKNDRRGKINFLEYYNKKKDEHYESKGNYDNWGAAQIHLEKFCKHSITFEEVNQDFVKAYKKYLDKEALTKSGQPLSANTKYTYYNKFKACINAAFEEGYLSENPIRGVKSFEMADSQREYLTFNELQALYKAECKYDVLKRAFIFSCLTGLRWSDINTLLWSEVRDEDNGSRVIFRQEKTDGLEYLDISNQARSLLGERKDPNERAFKGLKYGAHFNSEILRWCMRAGLTKHITFHSGRHTNAVLMLENNADIYTVSKRLGHKELRTTEIYAKIIDKKMKEAANIIPELKL
ncbi:tyrosine-type recombinase/integrase [Dysgonomonas sp. ZJ279]|uniref:tyrosine-type recombinase/integrase n=1 Tax=Dysgonomonas sp. ZJ279 TaxID=2709796 RepID=UPI0013E9FA1E|nr:site-specific integrase [Dysgonomonas sp. ZJ279]